MDLRAKCWMGEWMDRTVMTTRALAVLKINQRIDLTNDFLTQLKVGWCIFLCYFPVDGVKYCPSCVSQSSRINPSNQHQAALDAVSASIGEM